MGKIVNEVFLVLAFTVLCGKRTEGSIQEGGSIGVDTTVHGYDTPMLIKNDIIVEKDVTLTIEAGAELRFAPGVTLGVNGTLIAKVCISISLVVIFKTNLAFKRENVISGCAVFCGEVIMSLCLCLSNRELQTDASSSRRTPAQAQPCQSGPRTSDWWTREP